MPPADCTEGGAAARGLVPPPVPGPNLLLPAIGLLALAAAVILAVADRDVYEWLADLWSFNRAIIPFADMDGPLAWIRCWRQGVDVYSATPCDVIDRAMNYSPLLLRLPLPWVHPESTAVYALSLDTLFLVSLAVLPRPRFGVDAVPMLVALFSPFCVFGLERANLDLLMFAMAALAVLCLERGLTIRVVGYAAIVAAGLLKFYPWILLFLLLRERRTVFLLLSAVFAVILVAFILRYHVELQRMLDNMPPPLFFDDNFGSSLAPYGLVAIALALHGQPNQLGAAEFAVFVASKAGLYGAALIGSLRLSRSAALQRAIARLSVREATCLAVGAALMSGCFFVAPSIGYRAVHLLFALPGMLALARVADGAAFARLVRCTIGATLVLFWSLLVQRLIAATFGPFWSLAGISVHPLGALFAGTGFWLLREGLWWWLMTFLLSVVARTVLDSRVWRDTTSSLTGARG